jgi:hypothetical protein
MLSTVGYLLTEVKEMTMNMKRVLEPVDLMVAAGIVAIVIGALLVFMSTQGHFRVADSNGVAHREASDPVQPALGQTIVAISFLERERSGKMKTAVTKLNQATMTTQQINSSTHDQITALAEQADKVQVENTARAELVKGRSIVNFSTRAIRNGSPSDQQREEYDHRMIHSAAKAGRMIEEDYQRTKESNIGRAIVAGTQSQMNATHRNQEQVGAAIVQVALVQDEYQKAVETAQEQLGLLVSVSARDQP